MSWWEIRCKNMGGWRFRQARSKKSAAGFYYRKMFRGDGMVECSVLKKLELTAKKIERSKAVSDRVVNYDKARRKRVAELERRRKFAEEQRVSPEAAP